MNHTIKSSGPPRPNSAWQVIVVFFVLATAMARAAEAEFPPLTTVEGNPRLPGKFIWADLVTDDVPKARDFYAQLFGWKFWGMGTYSVAMNDGQPLAGMFQKARPANDPKAKPRWFGYISVPNVSKPGSNEVKKRTGAGCIFEKRCCCSDESSANWRHCPPS